MNNTFSEKLSRRLAARFPRKKHFTLSQKNIYIIPSKSGFVFLGLISLLLLTAINYQNSLIYLFTFFLSAIFFISIWLCFLNVNGLAVSSYDTLSCFEGEPCQYSIQLTSKLKPALSLALGPNKQALISVDVIKDTKTNVCIYTSPEKRGVHQLDRLRIETYYPFGFIVAWTWLKLDVSTLVFPKPVEGVRTSNNNGELNHLDANKLSDDLDDLKHYQAGDLISRISWKHLAAKDQLIVRKNVNSSGNSLDLTWQQYQGNSVESKLQNLCFDVLDLARKQQAYSLDIPGKKITSSTGEKHKLECLRALAMYGYTQQEVA